MFRELIPPVYCAKPFRELGITQRENPVCVAVLDSWCGRPTTGRQDESTYAEYVGSNIVADPRASLGHGLMHWFTWGKDRRRTLIPITNTPHLIDNWSLD